MQSLLEPPLPKKFSSDEAFQDFLDNHCTYSEKGTSRRVYAVNGDKYVVKVAIDQAKTTCNWLEVVAYLEYTEYRSKLANVISWSCSGKFIIMEKLNMESKPPQGFDPLPWVTDNKESNIGRSYDGDYKTCDYALIKPPDRAYQSNFA